MVFKTFMKGIEGVSLGVFILGGVVSIVMALTLFWTQHNVLLGVLGILSCFGFCTFISLLYNLTKISQMNERIYYKAKRVTEQTTRR